MPWPGGTGPAALDRRGGAPGYGPRGGEAVGRDLMDIVILTLSKNNEQIRLKELDRARAIMEEDLDGAVKEILFIRTHRPPGGASGRFCRASPESLLFMIRDRVDSEELKVVLKGADGPDLGKGGVRLAYFLFIWMWRYGLSDHGGGGGFPQDFTMLEYGAAVRVIAPRRRRDCRPRWRRWNESPMRQGPACRRMWTERIL